LFKQPTKPPANALSAEIPAREQHSAGQHEVGSSKKLLRPSLGSRMGAALPDLFWCAAYKSYLRMIGRTIKTSFLKAVWASVLVNISVLMPIP
jgi:hypothetical protein